MEKSGCLCDDIRVYAKDLLHVCCVVLSLIQRLCCVCDFSKRLIALAAQHFVLEVAHDAKRFYDRKEKATRKV